MVVPTHEKDYFCNDLEDDAQEGAKEETGDGIKADFKVIIRCHRAALLRLKTLEETVTNQHETSAILPASVSLKLFLHILGYAYTDDYRMFQYTTVHPVDNMNIQVQLEQLKDHGRFRNNILKHNYRIPHYNEPLPYYSHPGKELFEAQMHIPFLIEAAQTLGYHDMVRQIFRLDWSKNFNFHGCERSPDAELGCSCPLYFNHYFLDTFVDFVSKIYNLTAPRSGYSYKRHEIVRMVLDPQLIGDGRNDYWQQHIYQVMHLVDPFRADADRYFAEMERLHREAGEEEIAAAARAATAAQRLTEQPSQPQQSPQAANGLRPTTYTEIIDGVARLMQEHNEIYRGRSSSIFGSS